MPFLKERVYNSLGNYYFIRWEIQTLIFLIINFNFNKKYLEQLKNFYDLKKYIYYQ